MADQIIPQKQIFKFKPKQQPQAKQSKKTPKQIQEQPEQVPQWNIPQSSFQQPPAQPQLPSIEQQEPKSQPKKSNWKIWFIIAIVIFIIFGLGIYFFIL